MDQRQTRSNSSATAALILLLLALVLALAACGGGSAPPDPGDNNGANGGDNGGDTPTKATLNATIKDAAGQPLGGVAVLLGLNAAMTGADGQVSYENLLPGTYTVTMQDGAGNYDGREVTLAAGESSVSFTLPNPSGGLAVTEVSPALNSTGAGLGARFVMQFNDDYEVASVASDDFTITPDIGDVELAVVDPLSTGSGEPTDSAYLALVPTQQLPTNQQILVELTGSINAADGSALTQPVRWRFKTSAADDYPPQLTGSSPADGQTNVPPNLPVRFDFTEKLGALDDDVTFTIAPAAAASLSVVGSSLYASFAGGLEINTAYTATLSGVPDELDNRDLVTVYTLGFTTGEQPAALNYREPEWVANSDLIVFAADNGGTYDIFSIKPDGTELTQLTALPGDERHPTVSHSGELLAFQYRAGGKWSIWVLDLTGGEPVQITSDDYNDTEPQFSRTLSDRIIFTSDRSQPRGLYLMNADGSNAEEQDSGFGSAQGQAALHPLLDTQMLFTAGGGDDRDIWRKTVSAIDGSAINQNFTGDLLADDHSPAWGPDAGYFVFISDFAGVDNLWYAEATGEFEVQLTEFDQPVLDACVSPVNGDARAIISVEDGNGGTSLVFVDLVSGDVLSYLTGGEAGD
ncbi:Ig-like domain-containing protein [bacterium]|nr:Ig-like domain-containing protein [bacterium]